MNYRQHRNYENLEKQIYPGDGKYGIPKIWPIEWGGVSEFVGFDVASSQCDTANKGVHFFIDDYRFLRIWNNPGKYVDMLARYKYVMSPDFSIYTDFPVAIQIYNHYRKHWIGAYLQAHGIDVIPTIGWSSDDSYEWCFDGEPINSVVAISSVGTQKDKRSKELFLRGYQEMVRVLDPETIIFYGDVPKECNGNIVRVKSFQDKFKEAKCDGW